jgi:hypothetical protein
MASKSPVVVLHEFAIGDLVLFDEVIGAVVIKLKESVGVSLYDLRTEGGWIERNVVSGYLRGWPETRARPTFQPLRRL